MIFRNLPYFLFGIAGGLAAGLIAMGNYPW